MVKCFLEWEGEDKAEDKAHQAESLYQHGGLVVPGLALVGRVGHTDTGAET
jgi:hypothetical protein